MRPEELREQPPWLPPPGAPNAPAEASLAEPDSAETEALCRRVVGRLCHRSWLLRRDREDLLQEARILAWQHAGHPLAERVVQLRLIDRIRSSYGRSLTSYGRPVARFTGLTRTDVIDLEEAAAGVEPPVDIAVVEADAAVQVLRAVTALPDPQRDVILGTVRGKTLRELASERGLSESAVCVRRQHARRRLRALLDESARVDHILEHRRAG